MDTLTANMRRTLQSFYKTKRSQRPKKKRRIKEQIRDTLLLEDLPSPASKRSSHELAIQSATAQDQSSRDVRSETQPAYPYPEHEDFSGDVEDGVERGTDTELDSRPSHSPVEKDTDHPSGGFQQPEEEGLSEEELRSQTYCTVFPEDPEDYTAGPPRMVIANDGVKDCAGLLMTLTLSNKIKQSIRAQRGFAKAEIRAEQELEVILNFEFELDSEVSNHQYRLSLLQNETSDDPASTKRCLEQELAVLQLMQQDAEARRKGIDTRRQTLAKMLRTIQADVNAYLEDAFIHALLLEPEDDLPDTPIEALDLQKEYGDFCRSVQRVTGQQKTPTSPLDTTREHFEVAPLSAEDQAKADLHDTYWHAQQRLQSAKAHFDNRERDQQAEMQANFEAVDRGEEPMDATPEDFDLRWLKHEQDLTHELIEAENALAEVKTAAIAAGVELAEDDKASGFIDDVADGYRMSFEKELVASVPSATVKNWLSDIPDLASPSFNDRVDQTDDWEAEDVKISDSVSMVAEGAERRRIDKWREVCGL